MIHTKIPSTPSRQSRNLDDLRPAQYKYKLFHTKPNISYKHILVDALSFFYLINGVKFVRFIYPQYYNDIGLH